MIQEYLLKASEEKRKIEAYMPDGINKRLYSTDKGKGWIVQFVITGENEGSAKKLSIVDEYIRESYHVTVLKNGCSAYFNQKLYPLIREFEYSLRNLLYITSALNQDEKSAANIADLESKDFGQLFSLLFIDISFMEKAKEEIKKRNKDDFSKADVLSAIEAIPENTVWDSLLSNDTVPTLRKRFNDVRTYRNDVMHFHHLNYERYKRIQKLYKTINTEIDNALRAIEITDSQVTYKPVFNEILEQALRAQEAYSLLLEAMKPSLEELQRFSEIYNTNIANPVLIERWKAIKDALAMFAKTQSPQLPESNNLTEDANCNQSSSNSPEKNIDSNKNNREETESETKEKDDGGNN